LKRTFRISRFKKGIIDPCRFDVFEIEIGENASLLDALETIRTTHDASLMYRHSCHHSSCGTCACRINGEERLACTTRIADLGEGEIVVEPLSGFPVISDLVVDMTGLFRDIEEGWGYIRASEWNPESESPPGVHSYQRLENCIECGACVSACPAARGFDGFMGPASLAALDRELQKRPKKAPELLRAARSERGEGQCIRALRCSAVCPTGVFPARHIMNLRRRLAGP
jgi:succinate dehydrogenase / fumarate reductase iron-sulfur subunit